MARLASALLALALLLPLSACDDAEPAPPASSFEATVSGARDTTLSGEAWSDVATYGIPSRQILLDGGPVGGNEGGISFSRAYATALRPGTFAVNTEAGLNGGFSAFLTLPAEPTPTVPGGAETFWAFDGTLTVTSVTGGVAEGTFSFRAGPGPGVVEPEVVAEGSFTAALGDEYGP